MSKWIKTGRKGFKWVLIESSVEKGTFLLVLRFYVKLILADCKKVKNCNFNNFEGFDFTEFFSLFSRSLEIVPNDPKALFRRCQAHEALGQVDSAYKDAREVHRVDPKNPAIEPVLVRLHKAVSLKVSISRSIHA